MDEYKSGLKATCRKVERNQNCPTDVGTVKWEDRSNGKYLVEGWVSEEERRGRASGRKKVLESGMEMEDGIVCGWLDR
jgi:hypothetical protein